MVLDYNNSIVYAIGGYNSGNIVRRGVVSEYPSDRLDVTLYVDQAGGIDDIDMKIVIYLHHVVM